MVVMYVATSKLVCIIDHIVVMCFAFLQNAGWTALHVAAFHNSVDIVNVLLKNDPTLIKKTTKVHK